MLGDCVETGDRLIFISDTGFVFFCVLWELTH